MHWLRKMSYKMSPTVYRGRKTVPDTAKPLPALRQLLWKLSGESDRKRMNQSERRNYLIQKLLEEQPQYAKMQIPGRCEEQKTLLRALMNVRMPGELSEEFLQIQDAYLAEENAGRGIVTLAEIQELSTDLYLWKGDITRLQVGAIVNAANSGMTGCYQPCHNCIDNCIHTYAGIELRNYCNDIMQRQGYAEPTRQAEISYAVFCLKKKICSCTLYLLRVHTICRNDRACRREIYPGSGNWTGDVTQSSPR